MPLTDIPISQLPKHKKWALFEDITLDNRYFYWQLSCKPMPKTNEDDMELLSDIVTWGELYTPHFEPGTYHCSRCALPLYSSDDKWKGPCVWPSFRRGIDSNLSTNPVMGYNGYKCSVEEVYCQGCGLFIGHQFEDGIEKGDMHPEARWRH